MADLSNQLCNICCVHYNAGLRCCSLGSNLEGGWLFAKTGGYAWIVAPCTTRVCRSWYDRNDAVTTAQASAACGDWFVPSRTQLMFGIGCRDFWDAIDTLGYWTDTDINAGSAPCISFLRNCYSFTSKSFSRSVRAFRIVSY